MSLLLPVSSYRGLSSWQDHINRYVPSSEPGTDLYVPIGTHLLAPDDGYIWGAGESIGPATGRWIGINFDNGMSYRSMHHSRNRITGGRVKRGDVYAFSGASGYGEEDWSWNVAETGGAHVHITLWPTHEHRYGYKRPGVPYTIDFMEHTASTAGGSSRPFPDNDDQGDTDMRTILHLETGVIYTFGPEQVKAETDIGAATTVRNITGSKSGYGRDWWECDNAAITALCESYGVPWSAVLACTNGEAYDIAGGRPGRFWSRQLELAGRGD